MRVAIVDDTAVNRLLMAALVGRLPGCEAEAFESPVDALAAVRAREFDLLVTDYLMPDLDGLGLVQAVRAVRPADELPIVMVTADHERAVRYRALELGASDFTTSPVDPTEFRARIANMLRIRRAWLAHRDRQVELEAAVRRATETIEARELDTVWRLARAAEARDPETGAHILRMSHYSAVIARELGWSDAEQKAILHAAGMHDIGKVATPDAILLKPGKLTPAEFEIMMEHTTNGWRILSGSDAPILQLAAEIAYCHHERHDGGGYPRGLGGDEIPQSARIVAVADVYDALTSRRPYKEPWPAEEARAWVEARSGSQFDPRCVAAFLRAWPELLGLGAAFPDAEPSAELTDAA